MIARLLWIVVVALAVWFVRSVLRSMSAPRASSSRREIPRSEGRMVRDRVCNTFLPASRAVSLEQDGTTHYFCSEQCRAAYLEKRRAAS